MPHVSRRGLSAWGTFLLVAWDAVAVLAAFALTAPVAGGDAIPALSVPAVVMALLGLLAVGLAEGYDPYEFRPGRRAALAGRLMVAATAAAWGGYLVAALLGRADEPAQLALVWAVAPVAWTAGRLAGRPAMTRVRERVVVLGTGAVAQRVATLLARHQPRSAQVVGFVDDDPLPAPMGAPPHLGGIGDLGRVLEAAQVDRVIVGFPRGHDRAVLEAIRECDAHSVHLDVVPRMFDLLGPVARPTRLGGLTLLSVRGRRATGVQRAGKRALDVVGATVLGILTLPVTLAVALAIRLDDGGPVLFRQPRVGRGGRPFRVIKFRTMSVALDEDEVARLQALAEGRISISEMVSATKSTSTDRITRVGHLLRRTSLDELPQLWNVLRGDMSLVGPRPLRDFEVAALDGWQRRRQEVLPGITGLWQVLGRSDIGWEERMQLDYDYVRHWSVGRDIGILARTVRAVLARKGAV